MKYRYLDIDKVRYSSQSSLPAILAALPIPEDYENLEEIEHLLKPKERDPNERISLDEIQAELESKIDKITRNYIALSRHRLELSNYDFREWKKKQDWQFDRLSRSPSGLNSWVENWISGITVSSAGDSILTSSGLSCFASGPDIALKPRNWLAKQILRLLLDTKAS